VRKMCW